MFDRFLDEDEEVEDEEEGEEEMETEVDGEDEEYNVEYVEVLTCCNYLLTPLMRTFFLTPYSNANIQLLHLRIELRRK
jgi:hypothetical protein